MNPESGNQKKLEPGSDSPSDWALALWNRTNDGGVLLRSLTKQAV
jgi:hypothetical protein